MEPYHDKILKAAHSRGLSEVQAMNALQDQGVISDLCVWIEDIAEADAPKAEMFLLSYGQNNTTRKTLPR